MVYTKIFQIGLGQWHKSSVFSVFVGPIVEWTLEWSVVHLKLEQLFHLKRYVCIDLINTSAIKWPVRALPLCITILEASREQET